MENDRYPRLSYKLFHLDSTPGNNLNYDWVSQIKNIFLKLDYIDLWYRQNPYEIQRELLFILDFTKLFNSGYNSLYAGIRTILSNF